MRVTNGNFYSGNSCKWLVPSCLHELLEQKFPFVTRIESIRLTLTNISAHVSRFIEGPAAIGDSLCWCRPVKCTRAAITAQSEITLLNTNIPQ